MKRESNQSTKELVKDIFTDGKSISEETLLLPQVIAAGITQDPAEIKYLVNRAERHWLNSPDFKKAITQRGNKGRDNLYIFMEHWLKSIRLGCKKAFSIYVDNSKAQSFNTNIDSPRFFCFAQSEEEAIQKMKASDFEHKNKPILNIHSKIL